MIDKREIINFATWGIFAGFAGIAKFLSSRMDENAPELSRARFKFLVIANIFVSAFSGIMGALIASSISDSHTFIDACAGVFGFLGARGIEILGDKLSQKI